MSFEKEKANDTKMRPKAAQMACVLLIEEGRTNI